MLATDGPATATGLAARVGESSGTTSWHLRHLAEHGLVEEDPDRGNRRERWWRAAQDSLQVRWDDFGSDPADARALAVYLHEVFARDAQRAHMFLAGIDSWPARWRRAFAVSSVRLRLSAAELEALNRDILALARRYERPERPSDEVVVVQWQSFPHRGYQEEAGP
jgi:hypothetical protein